MTEEKLNTARADRIMTARPSPMICDGAFIISKNFTEDLGYDSIEKEFRKWRNILGPNAKKYTLHGLRKLACMHLAEAGCLDAQIQAITNQSAEMVTYHRKQASRKRLSKEASRLKSESAKNAR